MLDRGRRETLKEKRRGGRLGKPTQDSFLACLKAHGSPSWLFNGAEEKGDS